MSKTYVSLKFKYNILALFMTNCYLLSEGFVNVIIKNFVVVSSVGIKSVVCTGLNFILIASNIT